MNFIQNLPRKLFTAIFVIIMTTALVAAQQTRGSLRGLITDELGAAIVGANVTLTDSTGTQKKTITNGEGVYTFAGLAPGKYSLVAIAPGFAPSDIKEVEITGARQSVDLTLKVTIEEKVTDQRNTGQHRGYEQRQSNRYLRQRSRRAARRP